jgi:signal transduction histidine kinase
MAALRRLSALDEVRRPPFFASLAQLVRANAAPGVRVRTRVLGEARPTPPATEVLLWRVSEELVQAVTARSRATRLDAVLEMDDERLVLTLHDDGLPLAHRCGGATGLFRTLRRLARLCEDAGGQLEVRNALPLGVEAVTRIPVDPRLQGGTVPPPRRSGTRPLAGPPATRPTSTQERA